MIRSRRSRMLFWSLPPIVLAGLFVTPAVLRSRQAAKDAALIRAVRAGRPDAVDEELRGGANPNARDLPPQRLRTWHDFWRLLTGNPGESFGPSAIRIAAENSHWDVVERLLRAGAEHRTVRLQNDMSLLMAAAGAGATKCCLTLISVGENPDGGAPKGDTPLIRACEGRKSETARALIMAGAHVNYNRAYGYTPLIAAAANLDAETVRLMLDRGADVNAKNMYDTPLSAAAGRGRADMVRLLLGRGARVNERAKMGFSPIAAAAKYGDLDTLKLLLAAGARLDERGQEAPLIQAFNSTAGSDDAEVVHFLLAHGADPDVRGESDVRPISLAIEGGDADIVQDLLKHGAKVNPLDRYEEAPLDQAVRCEQTYRDEDHREVVQVLKAAGAHSTLWGKRRSGERRKQ